MSVIDRLYYQRRAETELDMAQHARNPAVAHAHYTLLARYLDPLHLPRAEDHADRAMARA